jgi:hypothetical protein
MAEQKGETARHDVEEYSTWDSRDDFVMIVLVHNV